MKIKRKPVEFEVWQFTKDKYNKEPHNYPMIIDMADIANVETIRNRTDRFLMIAHNDNTTIIHEGDYIIKSSDGKFYKCDAELFEMFYDIIE